MPEIIVALDVPTVAEAKELVRQIGAEWYKIGLELIYADGGLDFVKRLVEIKSVFLDAKLSDIPTTVERAVQSIVRNVAPDILSVRNQIDAAMDAAEGSTTWIAHVPFLTSDEKQGVISTPADAVVCGSYFAEGNKNVNPRARTICPGIRLQGHDADDHVLPSAGNAFADFVVVGRPITRADDPRAAFMTYAEAMA